MVFLALAVQILIAIIIPIKIIDYQYRKKGSRDRVYILVFGIINFMILCALNVTLYYPNSVEKYWWFADAASLVFPIIANIVAKNRYPVFNKFDVAVQISIEEKENMINAVSEGVKKCCEELRGQPDDLRIFLNEQVGNGTVTELQATLLWEKFSIRNF